jgi:hypothetical protein
MGKSPEASPVKSLVDELELLRECFRVCLATYGAGIDGDLARLQSALRAGAGPGAPTAARLHDLRDMLGLCRTLDVKPDKGRRKDLKKFEVLIADLKMLMESW